MEPLFKRLGIHSHVVRGYEAFVRQFRPDEKSVNIGEARAVFSTKTQGEYRRVSTFLEGDIIADLIERVQPDDVFWDIGASTGPFTCLVASVLESGSVVAFEPHLGNIKSLQRNINLNGFDNVLAKQVALSDESGETDFAISSRNAGTGLHSMNGRGDREIMTVPMQRGDNLVLQSLPHPTVIKIDVEGSEQRVVDGMTEILVDERCRLIYCEVHGGENHPNSIRRTGTTPEAFCKNIKNLGFDVTIINSGPTFTIRAEKPDYFRQTGSST